MNICLVFLGDLLPEYVKANISYLKESFPSEKIWLLSDNERSLEIASKLSIQVWKCSNPILSWPALKDSELDLKFRNGFYFYALGRFSILDEFMESHSNESVLHIEADVWLAPNFPFHQIDQIKEEIAFPLERKSMAIPSTVYIKNRGAMSHLFSFLNDAVVQGRAPIDMFLLSLYATENSDRVHILPTAMNDPAAFNPSIDKETKETILKNHKYYDGIFDSSTWGQYLFGIDPKNYLGIRMVYHEQKNHAVSVKSIRLKVDEHGNIFLSQGNSNAYLYSLHIHSKDLRIFLPTRTAFLQKRIDEISSSTKYEFSVSVFLKSISFKALNNFLKIIWNKVKLIFRL